MKKFIFNRRSLSISSLLFSSLFITQFFNAQTPQQAAVELWANVQVSPPTVTINWVGQTSTNYSISKKLKTSATWTSVATGLSGTTTSFVDGTVSVGTNYEYLVMRTAPTLSYNGYGYINTGIEIPVVENRGKLILMVANNVTTALTSEIARLQDDLEGDGWTVLTAYVSPTMAVTAVKAIISATYALDPANTKALFLLGHVPVAYSGSFGPDAHPDHQGAWPTDSYYGEMVGTNWTDATVNVTAGLPVRTQNIPGDGKFDQNNSGVVELQVGRVDLANMTSFTLTETQLLKNYLDKDHDYRKKIFTATRRAVIDDNFGYFSGEAFAASGYKNFGPLVTPSNVIAGDYLTTMANNTSYLWSYGCGGGSFTSCSGVGVTANFTGTTNLGGVFTMLFGSYFGDWDIADNFLRAPLCQGKTLTNAWSGRPHLQFHHMGLGENIGYSIRASQNNTGTYYYSYAQNFIGIALMGDPTLRNDVVAPVSNVVATRIGNNCNISWSASTQTNVLGYNIYMRNDTNKTYVKINPSLISGTTYTDLCLVYPGIYKYMVRALVLENVPSGTYYNMSEGIADTAMNTNNNTIYGNAGIGSQVGSVVNFTAASTGGTTYNWNFGDATNSGSQNPSHTYTVSGNYTATLTVSNSCNSKTFTVSVGITTGITKNIAEETFAVFPNPSTGRVRINTSYTDNFDVTVYGTDGKQVFSQNTLSNNKELNLEGLTKGLYLIQLKDRDNRTISKKLIIE
jgi:PKD repeat protein